MVQEVYTFFNSDYKLIINSLNLVNGGVYYMMYILNDKKNILCSSNDIVKACIEGDDDIILMIYFFLTQQSYSKYVFFKPVVTDDTAPDNVKYGLNTPFYICINYLNVGKLSSETIKHAYDDVVKDFNINKQGLCNNIFLEVSKKNSEPFDNTYIIPSIDDQTEYYFQDYKITDFQNITSLINDSSYDIFKKYIHCIYKFTTSGPNKNNYLIHFSGVTLDILHCKIKSILALPTVLNRGLGLYDNIQIQTYLDNCYKIEHEILSGLPCIALLTLIDELKYDEILNLLNTNSTNVVATYNSYPLFYNIFTHILSKYNSEAFASMTCNKLLNILENVPNIKDCIKDGRLFYYLLKINSVKFDFSNSIHEQIALILLRHIDIASLNYSLFVNSINYILPLESVSIKIINLLFFMYEYSKKINSIDIFVLPETHKNFDYIIGKYIITYFGFMQNNINMLYETYKNKQNVIKSNLTKLITMPTTNHAIYKINTKVIVYDKPGNIYNIENVITGFYDFATSTAKILLLLRCIDDKVFDTEFYQLKEPDMCNIYIRT